MVRSRTVQVCFVSRYLRCLNQSTFIPAFLSSGDDGVKENLDKDVFSWHSVHKGHYIFPSAGGHRPVPARRRTSIFVHFRCYKKGESASPAYSFSFRTSGAASFLWPLNTVSANPSTGYGHYDLQLDSVIAISKSLRKWRVSFNIRGWLIGRTFTESRIIKWSVCLMIGTPALVGFLVTYTAHTR